MHKIIGFGNALVDVLVLLEDNSLLNEFQLPLGGMTLINEEVQASMWTQMQTHHPQLASGGSASNTILALAGLGHSAGFIGMVGKDEMGDFYCRHLFRLGVEARMMENDSPTGVANTLVSPGGERTFGTFLGAAGKMKASDITSDMLDGYHILHVEGYLVTDHELIESVFRMAQQAGMLISLDLASFTVVKAELDFLHYLVRTYVDIVFANEEEAYTFTGLREPQQALMDIAALCSTVIIKQGATGSSAMRSSEQAFFPACKVPVVDTTAAGDFFAAGFLYALVRKATLQQCLECGTIMASKVIQVVGTKITEPVWTEARTQIQQILS